MAEITITIAPGNQVGQLWTVTAAGGNIVATNVGQGVIRNLPADDYSVLWSEVAGYDPPDNPSEGPVTVGVGGSYEFISPDYDAVAGQGTIDVSPDDEAASWSIWPSQGSQEFASGIGSASTLALPGAYTITWNDNIYTKSAAASEELTLVDSGSIDFIGTYPTRTTGSVGVNIQKNGGEDLTGLTGAWTVSAVAPFAGNLTEAGAGDNASLTGPFYTGRQYRIVYTQEAGFTTPANETITISGSHTYTGDFTESSGVTRDLDVNGWTILNPVTGSGDPADDSVLIYVSDTLGLDTNDGSAMTDQGGGVGPVKTAGAAFALARAEKPDWILFRRGDTFPNQTVDFYPGAARTSPFVVTSYHETPDLTLDRPLFDEATGFLRMNRSGGSGDYFCITDLDFHNTVRDPLHGDFVSVGTNQVHFLRGMGVGDGNSGDHCKGWLIEGCKFQCSGGIGIMDVGNDTNPWAAYDDMEFRRCVWYRHYSASGDASFYQKWTQGLVYYECVFELIGIYEPYMSYSNTAHSMYFSNPRDLLMEGCICGKGPSAKVKHTANGYSEYNGGSNYQIAGDITHRNNLHVDGYVSLNIGGNNRDPDRFYNITYDGNVFWRLGDPNPYGQALAMESMGWSNGAMTDNYFIGTNDPGGADNVRFVGGSGYGVSKNVTITGNVCTNVFTTSTLMTLGNLQDSVTFSNNITVQPWDTNGGFTAGTLASTPGTGTHTFANNTWWSARPTGNWFSSGDYASWVAATGETGGSTTEPTFVDDTRDPETYYETVMGGPASDYAGFLQKCMDNQKHGPDGGWDQGYTATNCNAWIKAGYATV